MSEKTIALLVAAGKSERMEGDIPKPYLPIAGEPMIRHTMKAFLNHPDIDGVRVVIRREHHALYKQAAADLSLFPCVIGGNTRQQSVCRGLESIYHRRPEKVLVHDIARPMVSSAIISNVVAALDQHKAVVPAMPVHDTVRRIYDGKTLETVDRQYLYAIQTPQGFHFDVLFKAHKECVNDSFTDDAALMQKMSIPVATVPGDTNNIKVTTIEDINHMQEAVTQQSQMRVGMGYDVHALKAHDPDTPVPKQRIKLCGIKIPFTHHLIGNSDADVGMHAIVDAILGAAGLGDIGIHFPPDDLKWQGADSSRFLIHAYELVTSKGGEIINIDVTLICEKPKISEHREAMIAHLSQILKLPPSSISVKATTTEKLGFTGRGEGIAAQAVAMVKMPKVQS
ncbi:MAG: bifunctional 2-C-methyl-D-erythritol 4-phosphate cytidylyltransferase/2-C-methyl-D-erythritol 2,4-cyclodiphosphate synthase [Rickettsiales bacterium]